MVPGDAQHHRTLVVIRVITSHRACRPVEMAGVNSQAPHDSDPCTVPNMNLDDRSHASQVRQRAPVRSIRHAGVGDAYQGLIAGEGGVPSRGTELERA